MTSHRKHTVVSAVLVLVCSAAARAAVVEGVVPADFPAGVTAPVAVPIPASLARESALDGRVTVAGADAGRVTLQVEPADPIAGTPTRGWFLWTGRADQLGKPITVELRPARNEPAEPACTVRYNDPLVEVTAPDRRPILAYRHSRPDPELKYPMTSYIHPLVGLDGEILTDCSPADHPHHRGLFWSWVRIMKDGQLIGETWIPRDIDMEPGDLSISQGPVLGRFAARHYWVHQPGFPQTTRPADAPAPKASDRLFQEDVVCRVFATSEHGRAIDLDLTLTALQDGLSLGGQTQLNKGYGGVTLRFSTAQQGKATQPQVVADGRRITQPDVNRLEALWVDWTGIFNGPNGKPLPHRSGGAIFVHPTHPPLPASPPEWITRFYGPINPTYPGLDMLDIPPDKPMRLKYRIWIHRGDAAEGAVEPQYRAYAADWRWKMPA